MSLKRVIEPPAPDRPSLRALMRDLRGPELGNGLVGFLFSATGPVAIVLSVAGKAGLPESITASWLFAIFCINGLITLLMTWRYNQPMCFFWTIPGTVLVGAALGRLSFAEVAGAYLTTSLIILGLGLSGKIQQTFDRVPMPIIMAMVAGVFLRFGLDIVRALHSNIGLAGVMFAIFLLLSAVPRLGRLMPPVLGALIVGVIYATHAGAYADVGLGVFGLARPVLVTPMFTWPATAELVVPIAITILVIQNGQGYAVLSAAGHRTPFNATTLACGVGGVVSAAFGAIGTCLTGPTNAIITSSGVSSRHYAAATVTGALAIIFGMMAPTVTRFLLSSPKELIAMLGGLAMLKVLQSAFVAAFSGPSSLGALVCFLVTVADLPIFNIGAPFWGLLGGLALSALLERSSLSR